MFVATRDTISAGLIISEADAEGVGTETRLRIAGSGLGRDIQLAEGVGRLVLLALNMDGGLDRALSILRAETVRQRA